MIEQLKEDWKVTRYKKVAVVINIIAIIAMLPIWRYNLIELNTKYNLIQLITNRDINALEVVVGNIYSTIIELINFIKYF